MLINVTKLKLNIVNWQTVNNFQFNVSSACHEIISDMQIDHYDE